MKELQHICVAKLADTFIGFDVQTVRSVYEVSEVLPLPIQLHNIIGVFNRRGKVLSIVDSIKFCSLQSRQKKNQYYTLLHLESNGNECCLTMDSVEEVKEVDRSTLREPPSGLNSALKKFCTSVLLDQGNRTIMILDFQHMFAELCKDEHLR